MMFFLVRSLIWVEIQFFDIFGAAVLLKSKLCQHKGLLSLILWWTLYCFIQNSQFPCSLCLPHLELIILHLYRTYLCHCEDFLGSAEEILTKGMPDLLEGDKNGFSEVYPTLTKSTFAVYYKTVFTELVTCAKGIQPGKQREDRDVSNYIYICCVSN